MNDVLNMKKMRAAHIPTYAINTNFDKTGLNSLKARVTSKPVIDAVLPTNFYLQSSANTKPNMQRTVVATGLVAKALALYDKPVICVRLAGLMREVRFAEMEREARSFNPVMEHIGRGGYIAIADLLEFNDVQDRYGYHAVQLAADHLIEHVERGGGLIIGATSVPLIDATQFGSSFAAMLQDNFESYTIA